MKKTLAQIDYEARQIFLKKTCKHRPEMWNAALTISKRLSEAGSKAVERAVLRRERAKEKALNKKYKNHVFSQLKIKENK